ncbi:MAG: hypothetical protein HY913_03990 [Desulfomonile tiedjei]|nr:hypothetical protein [Desulfomonile tiedjei]
MWWTILVEILILIGSLAIFPAAVVGLLVLSDSSNLSRILFSREILHGLTVSGGAIPHLWFRFVAPYLVVQAIRAYFWSQRSLTGRKWGNLYFSILLFLLGGWSLWNSWDLFYFMYALGDIPAELLQFVELEANNLMVAIASLALTVYCFWIFLDPTRKPLRRGGDEAR